MATTVTYKGATLTTVDNQTKVLQTAGTWVEDDFTLTDVSGGGTDYAPDILMNTLTNYTSNDVTSLCERAFSNRTTLQTVSLPNCTTSGVYAFVKCTGLVSAFLPNLQTIANNMFEECTSLTTYDFSNVTNLTNPAIFYKTKIREVYAPRCTGFGTWGSNHFALDTELIYFRAPKAGGAVRQQCFDGCTSLKLVDCGKITGFSVSNTFRNCTSLEVIILRNTSVVTLSNVNHFTNVTQNVKVYAPSAIRSSYANATNWSTLINNGILTFYDLEGSPYEDTDFVYMGVPA